VPTKKSSEKTASKRAAKKVTAKQPSNKIKAPAKKATSFQHRSKKIELRKTRKSTNKITPKTARSAKKPITEKRSPTNESVEYVTHIDYSALEEYVNELQPSELLIADLFREYYPFIKCYQFPGFLDLRSSFEAALFLCEKELPLFKTLCWDSNEARCVLLITNKRLLVARAESLFKVLTIGGLERLIGKIPMGSLITDAASYVWSKATDREKREALETILIDDNALLMNEKNEWPRLVDVKYENFPSTLTGITIKVSWLGNFFIDIDRVGFWETITKHTRFKLSPEELFSAYENLISLAADLIESFGYRVSRSDQEIEIERITDRP
jgi:hypothetical protein